MSDEDVYRDSLDRALEDINASLDEYLQSEQESRDWKLLQEHSAKLRKNIMRFVSLNAPKPGEELQDQDRRFITGIMDYAMGAFHDLDLVDYTCAAH